MLQFIKYVLATLLALVLFFFFTIIILIGLGTAAATKSEVKVKENSVLRLALDEPVREKGEENPFEALSMPGFSSNGVTSLKDIKRAIRAAKDDEKIKGIYLPLSNVQCGFAMLEDIRDELIEFKTSGKFIVAYGEYYSEKAYYLASVADSIYLNPGGVVEFNGIYSQQVYFTEMLNKIGVKPEIFRVGEYKSAVEPFFRKSMSPESREQTESFINSIYDHYLVRVADSRHMNVDRLTHISDSMLVRSAEDAVSLGLVDRLVYVNEVQDMLFASLGIDKKEKEEAKEDAAEDKDDDESSPINFISPGKYIKSVKDSDGDRKRKVAVLLAEGEITGAVRDGQGITSDEMVKQLRKLRNDDKVKAIVLRINSPGGSALASDIIWHEVMLTREKKPVIASMSDVAASGGYYIAMACDTIIAQPNTITGSIGVFGVLLNAKELLNDKLGITFDGVKTGEFSDIGNPTRPITDMERYIIQQEVEKIYEDFTAKAAQSRGMSQDSLKALASGRVWSGTEAMSIGLVDGLGGLDHAIAIAASAAGLEDGYRVYYTPKPESFLEQLLKDFGSGMETRFAKAKLGHFYQYVEYFEKAADLEGVNTRLPYDISIK